MAAAPPSNLTLHGSWADSHTHRVQLALRLKGLAFDYVEEDAGAVARYNPVFKKVPVLVHDGRPIVDSVVILHYIDETWPSVRPLLPSDPFARAVARFWCHFADSKLAPSVAAVFASAGEGQLSTAVAEVRANLRLMETELREGAFQGSRFFGGDGIGLLDVVLGCGSYWLAVFEEVMNGVKLVDAGELPLFHLWLRHFEEEPDVKATMPAVDKLLEYAAAARQMMVSMSQHVAAVDAPASAAAATTAG